jgi:3-hydroxyacyl-[acyl-carrier-protein] dehydratase
VISIPILLDRLCYRYPSMLVDAICEHDSGRRLVAVKNVTVNEEFFQGHFPGAPVMPAVLMLESWSQVAAILLLQREDAAPTSRVYLRGVNDARFRRQVVPGDRLRIEISLGRRRASRARRIQPHRLRAIHGAGRRASQERAWQHRLTSAASR